MRKVTSKAITRVSERFNLRVAVPRRATDFEFYFIFFVCLFDTLRFGAVVYRGSILLEEAVQKTKSVLPLSF